MDNNSAMPNLQKLAQAGSPFGSEHQPFDPIGTVETISGRVSVTRTDGTKVDLEAGDPLYQGDMLSTGEDGAIGIVFADQSMLAMDENSEMVLDEMIYDPDAESGSAVFSLFSGAATVVSGRIAKLDQDAMSIETPTATIGIRGTKIYLEQWGSRLELVNLPEQTLKGQTVGEIVVYNPAGELMGSVNSLGSGFQWDPATQAALVPMQMSEAQVDEMLAISGKMMPKTLDEKALDALDESEAATEEAEALAEEAEALEEEAKALAEESADAETVGAANAAAAAAAVQAQQAAEKAAQAAEKAAEAVEATKNDHGFKANVVGLSGGNELLTLAGIEASMEQPVTWTVTDTQDQSFVLAPDDPAPAADPLDTGDQGFTVGLDDDPFGSVVPEPVPSPPRVRPAELPSPPEPSPPEPKPTEPSPPEPKPTEPRSVEPPGQGNKNEEPAGSSEQPETKYDNTITGTSGKDSLTGTDANDYIEGLDGKDTLRGGGGDDKLDGGSHPDQLYGGAGNDELFGGLHNDKLFGDAGNDRLNGGAGMDTLTGGDDEDTFVFDVSDLIKTYGDLIVDFEKGIDKIELHGVSNPDKVELALGKDYSPGVNYKKFIIDHLSGYDTGGDGKIDSNVFFYGKSGSGNRYALYYFKEGTDISDLNDVSYSMVAKFKGGSVSNTFDVDDLVLLSG